MPKLPLNVCYNSNPLSGPVLSIILTASCSVSIHNFFEALRYVSTLLIIPLRIADNPFQWQMVALAVILSGFRLFRYATVLP